MNAAHSLLLGSSLVLAAALAACTSTTTIEQRAQKPATSADPTDPSTDGPVTDDGTGETDPTKKPDETDTAGTGSTPAIAATRMASVAAALAKGGVDVTRLPADMGDLTKTQRTAVMNSFTAALGGDCTGCHSTDAAGHPDFSAETPNMAVTRKMWTTFVTGMTLRDGSAVYCDTCHQGKVDFLDRSNGKAMSNWMQKYFVDGLQQANKTANTCATCHGSPFVADFLDDWKN